MVFDRQSRLENLEAILLFVSLFLPAFLFLLSSFLFDTGDATPVIFESASLILTISSLFLFLLFAIINSYMRLRLMESGVMREAVAAKMTFLVFTLLALLISSFYLGLPIPKQEIIDNSHTQFTGIVFLVYMSLTVYFLFSMLNRLSEWLRQRVSLILAGTLFLFVFSWVFWLSVYSRLEDKVDNFKTSNLEQWDEISDLSHDYKDFSLLEEYLGKSFPQDLNFKIPKGSVLTGVISLGRGKARLYFFDNYGINRVDVKYSFSGTAGLSLDKDSEIELVKQLRTN